MDIISTKAIQRRKLWVKAVREMSGSFGDNSQRLEGDLKKEVTAEGTSCLIDHLRLCGDIPECYGHDTSEEKQYSKYTDALLSATFGALGLKSIVLKERADAADVEVAGKDFSFVADAKAFRLSRTAKNQKDFKIQAMDGWKRGKLYAMVVCPIYQLPSSSSQIYQQACARNVCVFTYSHLAVLVQFAEIAGAREAERLLHEIFKVIPALNPSKDAAAYWLAVNRTMLKFSDEVERLWSVEKLAAIEAMAVAKDEALSYLADERLKIMRMSHDEAVSALIHVHKIESRINIIKALRTNGLLDIW